jgi:hypothetical protein
MVETTAVKITGTENTFVLLDNNGFIVVFDGSARKSFLILEDLLDCN